MLKKVTNSVLSLMSLRKSVARKLFKVAAGSQIQYQKVSDVEPGKVLVIAPHPDDEVLGCGGAILKHVKQKDPVKVVFFTDGSHGFPEGYRSSTSERKQLAKTREGEAKQAAKVLGITDLIFMRYKDGELAANKNNIGFLTQIIEDYDPDIVYIPAADDPNQDHGACVKIFYNSLGVLKNSATIFQYDVWSPVFANHFLNIEGEISTKIKAIRSYKSQLKIRHYDRAIAGLNAYRGNISGLSSFAEGSFRSDKKFFKNYRELVGR